jgi:hypothetical protein
MIQVVPALARAKMNTMAAIGPGSARLR